MKQFFLLLLLAGIFFMIGLNIGDVSGKLDKFLYLGIEKTVVPVFIDDIINKDLIFVCSSSSLPYRYFYLW